MTAAYPWHTVVVTTIFCGYCDNSYSEEWAVAPGDVAPLVRPPGGWLALYPGVTACPRHAITVTIDDAVTVERKNERE